MKFFLLGLNHRTSPVEWREPLAFSSGDIEKFISDKMSSLEASELCALSTCNRSEFYGVHDHSHIVKENLKKAVLEFKGVDLGIQPRELFYYFEDDIAVRHLFEVASGVDSMVIGETQILGQVKEAYTLSAKVGSNGPLINKIFHQAFRVGKRSRTETAIGEGILSVSHAAVELSRKIFSDLKNKSVLLVGAGEAGELALKHFKTDGIGKVWITNRSLEKAKDVSERLGGSVVPFEEYKPVLGKVDIAIFSTAAEKYLITNEDSGLISGSHKIDPLFIIDISVPRNVDPKVTEAGNVFLYDIDDLEGIVTENTKKREKEIKKVQGIIDDELKKYREWVGNLKFEPLLRLLKEEFEEIRKDVLSKNANKFGDKLEDAEALTKLITNKIVNRPLQKLKKFNVNTHNYILRASLLEELFKEDKEE